MESCDLPLEIVMEILTRTSLATVGSSRVTCKKINNMTYNSFFTELFHKRAKQILGYFIEDLKKNKFLSTFVSMDNDTFEFSLNFLSNSVKIQASTKQGILCWISQKPEHVKISRYYICKPSTKQWETIPNPDTHYFTEAVAMTVLSTKSLRYKIVRLSRHRQLPQSKKAPQLHYLHCEVFDSAPWGWKKLKHLEKPFYELFTLAPAIFAGGVAHWLTTDNRIFAFDFNAETSTIIQIPQHLCSQDYDRDLTLVELWVMKEHKNQKWKRKWRFEVEELRHIENYPYAGACYDADLMLVKGGHNIIFYNPKNGRSSVIGLKSGMSPMFIHPFHSDFDLVDTKKL